MKFELPPHGGKYKLVATKKDPNDIGLVVLCDTGEIFERREYSWCNVPKLYNNGLKKYLLSMKENIEAGVYDLDLLDEELGDKN